MIEHYIEGIGRVEYHTEDAEQANKAFRKQIVDILNTKDKQLSDMEIKLKEKDEQYVMLWKWAFQEIQKRDTKLAEKENTGQFGKFKSADELHKAYLNLEKEYTKSRQEIAKKDEQLNQYPYKNDVIEKPYEELKCAIDYLSTIEDKARFNYLSSINHSIDVLCEKHKARIRDIEGSICTIEKLEKQNNEYSDSLIQVLSENESLAARCTNLKAENETLKELKAKEIGEALSDGFNNFTVAVRNKLDKETILKYVKTHNDDKLKLLEDMRESLEDINDYLLKKGDITNRGSDKILDYIDCKIEQQKSILA